ncbi:protein Ycf2-like [Cucumis melo var. makuwa]|uniref:Protein Ycf2-like n=2 Tax=Cucumis melo TaxID=3656 RepID=A0A5A7SM13_CUCMM|nr:protein Ycf2-like [Cucumis melo var. makuwa]
MNKKFEELGQRLNRTIEEIKSQQPSSSDAQKTNEYMGKRAFEEHLDKVEEDRDKEEEQKDEDEDLNLELKNPKVLGKKDDEKKTKERETWLEIETKLPEG